MSVDGKSAKRGIRRVLAAVSLSRLSRRQTVRRCPICHWSGRMFDPGGPRHKQRYDSRCPKCGSVERHRLAHLIATSLIELDYTDVLHVAPEKQLSQWLQRRSANYLSIDLSADAMARMDITNLALASESRTLVWISHVLEHVEDDGKAIGELFRVLVPGGIAFVQVPIWRSNTLEDSSVVSPEDRKRVFFQWNHVRLYGLDIVERFMQVGFDARIFRAQDFGPALLLECGLSFASTNEVFVFQKTLSPA